MNDNRIANNLDNLYRILEHIHFKMQDIEQELGQKSSAPVVSHHLETSPLLVEEDQIRDQHTLGGTAKNTKPTGPFQVG